MHSYVAYGLRIRSHLPLPELSEAEPGVEADVLVRLGPIELGPCDPAADRPDLRVSLDGTRFWLDGVGTFAVRDGREIVINPAVPRDDRLLRFNLLGLAMALLLHQRNMVVLHASVVAIQDSAAAFVGHSHSGKSTTAAALHRRGYPMITDDIAAIDVETAGRPIVHPAFPLMRLWPEAAVSVGLAPDALESVYDGSPKRSSLSAEGFATQAVPLRAIYVMDYGGQFQTQPIAPAAAVAELLNHSFVAGILKPTGTAASHFHRCVKLAQSVRIVRLIRRRDMAQLDHLAESIEQDLEQSASVVR
jgi:hypothetical protein